MKKIISAVLSVLIILGSAACNSNVPLETASSYGGSSATEQSGGQTVTEAGQTPAETLDYKTMTAGEITAGLSLEEKAAQMVQPAVYNVTYDEMAADCYGSILSSVGASTPYTEWQRVVNYYQEAAVSSNSGIPYIYGQDDVHGVNYCADSVIFPHNIGIGAANDEELTYRMGLITADEAKLCYMLWNFAPCVAQAKDPRWGRTYESYSSELDIIKNLSAAYSRGLIDGGVLACPKHFFADGNAVFGTGENSDAVRLIDRGDAKLTGDEISELLDVYEHLIDTGVQTVMVSHGSVNGVKMHENRKYIMYLKEELGFEGFIVSDWNSVNNITGSSLKEKMINSVNSGIDMFMQVDSFKECMNYIVEGVNEGSVDISRVDDAVTRIIKVKKDLGLFEDPYHKNLQTVQRSVGSDEYRAVAEQLVEKSMVLLKNSGGVLPLKEGAKVFITGPAADNVKAQCGGWTGEWLGSDRVSGVTTILQGMRDIAGEYNLEIITDKERASEADIVLLAVGEKAYAEWTGDTEDMELTGVMGLDGNEEAIKEAEALGKPVVALIVAGRQVIIRPYVSKWEAIVMCYLPGSEGKGVADVLAGGAEFSGKLPMPWYNDVNKIGKDDHWLEVGYGKTY